MGREKLVKEKGPGNAGRRWPMQEGAGKCGRAQEMKGRHRETGKAIVMKPNESFKVSA